VKAPSSIEIFRRKQTHPIDPASAAGDHSPIALLLRIPPV
jgi:hypothetical protein